MRILATRHILGTFAGQKLLYLELI